MVSRSSRLLAFVCVGAIVSALVARADGDATLTSTEAQVILSLFTAVRESADETNRYANVPTAAALGEVLFHDMRLSGSGQISCASCHSASNNWTDGRATARGAADGTRNTPMLWNVGARRWLFWDGRAATLWSQALHPIESPTEMNGRREDVVKVIMQDAALRSLYETAFGRLPRVLKPPCERRSTCDDTINRVFANVGKALAAFETTLAARTSPFDAFLACLGTKPAHECRQLEGPALVGLRLFVGRAGCVNCHHGRDLTDDEFHNIMLPDRHGRVDNDLGRMYGIAEAKRDEFGPASPYSDAPMSERAILLRSTVEGAHTANSFRTPSLRQVALTAPYMHNGIYADLTAVIEHYSTLADAPITGHHTETVIAKLTLTSDEMEALNAFLRTLTSVEGARMGKRVPIETR